MERDEVVALNKLLDGSNDEYRGQLADLAEKEEKLELDMVRRCSIKSCKFYYVGKR